MTGNQATGLEVVTSAFRTLNVRAAGDPLTAEEAQEGFETLNQMLNAWETEALTVPVVERVTKTLTAAQASYTLGVGGQINHARPQQILGAGLIETPGATTPDERPIRVYTLQQWRGVAMKTQAGRPVGVWFDRAFAAGLGHLYTHPVSSAGGEDLVLYLPTPLAQFADLTTSYTFVPGALRAIKHNLELELAVQYAVDAVTFQRVTLLATESKAKLKRSNQGEQPEVGCDPAVLSRRRGVNLTTGESGGDDGWIDPGL